MQYFRNFEISQRFSISEGGVRYLIKRAQSGRLDLQLVEQNGRLYIANTAENLRRLDEAIRSGKKHLTRRARAVATPTAKFYELYSPAQVLDIINNIEVHREVPRQYNYFDGGADSWDTYVQRLYGEKSSNTVNATVQLLAANTSYIDGLLEPYRRVNVIDVGVGNAWPVKDFLAHLLAAGKLNRYVAIDISAAMLDIAERNIKEWFSGKVPLERYERDISHDRFAEELAATYQHNEDKDSINLVLLLGDTPTNFRAPEDVFKTVYNSMGSRDILLHTTKLDTPASRITFSFNTGDTTQPLPPQYKLIVDLLGIGESCYEIEMGFDEQGMERYLRLKLTKALTIQFKFSDGERIIDLDKDERILLWRAKHKSTLDALHQLDDVGFGLLAASHTLDYIHLLAIAGVRADAAQSE